MKTKLNFSTTKIRKITAGFLVILLIAVLSISLSRCKDDSLIPMNKKENTLTVRGGEDDPTTTDILELLGTACVPDIDEGNGCNDVEYTATTTVYLPAYTGCSFTVVYHYYECSIGGYLTDLTVGDFQILSHNCSGFTSGLNSALTAGGATLTNFLETFEAAVYSQLEHQLIASFVPVNGPYECLHGIYLNITFRRASCYKRCFFALHSGAETYVKVSCGSDCCERQNFVCRDEHGNIVTDVYYVDPSPPYCTDPPSFEGNPVLSRCTRETSCSFKCLHFD